MTVPDVNPIGRDASYAKAERRLSENAQCVLCGERDPEVIRERKPTKSFLELHHVAGRANDPDLMVVLCRNCHARMSARMPFYGVDLRGGDDRSVEERLVSLLRGLAVFFEQLARALMTWAEDLASGLEA